MSNMTQTLEQNRYDLRKLLRELSGEPIRDADDLIQQVRQRFNEHLADFPKGITYWDVIRIGLDNRWIESEHRAGIRISVPESEQTFTTASQ